jgi:hypothetical protein
VKCFEADKGRVCLFGELFKRLETPPIKGMAEIYRLYVSSYTGSWRLACLWMLPRWVLTGCVHVMEREPEVGGLGTVLRRLYRKCSGRSWVQM